MLLNALLSHGNKSMRCIGSARSTVSSGSRSSPRFMDKLQSSRSYCLFAKNSAIKYNKSMESCTRPSNASPFGSEKILKYSTLVDDKAKEELLKALEEDNDTNNDGEEIPLLEINESYLDSQKNSIELVLKRDLTAREVKVYDFRDLNISSNCGVSFEIEIWCEQFKDKTLLQQHRLVIDTLQHYNKSSKVCKEPLLDIDNFHSIVIRTHV